MSWFNQNSVHNSLGDSDMENKQWFNVKYKHIHMQSHINMLIINKSVLFNNYQYMSRI